SRRLRDNNGDDIGDLQGIIEKLPYLKELEIDFLWLNPIYTSPNDDNGYDIANYQGILPEFGTMEDFHELLDQAHQLGLKI
ncbi:alpha-amylase family glycosyl hydrolase, partial [Enterococcus faecalis]|uniref:alpha-amylase family glycosyl hydrolase n=1 Tax=Enterococcus faecalis TaxID=1351 RepID=UPI003D6BC646